MGRSARAVGCTYLYDRGPNPFCCFLFSSFPLPLHVILKELVRTWLRGVNANQNTFLYGRVSDRDGIWRGEYGEVIQANGVAASSFIKKLKGLREVL